MWDSIAVAAVADELRAFVGGRIQRVVQTDPLSLGFELYARGERRWLLCTADPQRAGAWFVGDKLGQSPAPPSPMLLLCRKHLRGATLDGVEQPPFERILRLRLQADDETASRSLVLIVEAMGRLGNAILVDEQGLIVESIKRVGPSINRHRQIVPRRAYVGPPEQTKASPLDADAGFWAQRLLDPKTPAVGVVTGAVRGLSPLAAREVVFRASGRSDAPAGQVDPARLAAALAELLAPLGASGAVWQSSVGLEGGRVVAFAPYALTHLPEHERFPTLSEAAERFAGQAAGPTPIEQRQASLRGEVEAVRTREQRRLESIERELAGADRADELRTAGELLLAYASQIAVGSDRFESDGVSIELDPTLSPVENSQRYFERYARQRDARRRLPELIAAGRRQVAYLDEALVHLSLARTPEDVEAIRRELLSDGTLGGRATPSSDAVSPAPTSAGQAPRSGGSAAAATRVRARGKTAPGPGAASAPLKLKLGDHTVYVGRTARQNDQATFDLATANDLWLHARGVSGAHVILRTDVGKPSEETIRQAAAIAAQHSEARTAGSVPVDVTERRHVRKIKGGPPGAVTYSGERTIQVAPTRAESLRSSAAPSTGRSAR